MPIGIITAARERAISGWAAAVRDAALAAKAAKARKVVKLVPQIEEPPPAVGTSSSING